MNSLTGFGLQRSRVTILVMLLMLAIGFASYLSFPKREDPAITVRTAIVLAANPGLGMAQLEELIALPLEETARGVPGVSEVRSKLTGGEVILEIDIADTVQETDLKRIFDELRDDVNGIASTMPEGTVDPIVNSDFGDVAIATIAVTGAGFALPEIKNAAEDLRDRLYAVDGIAAVTLYGIQKEVIELGVDRARLASNKGTLNVVLSALEGQNVRLPAGSVVNDGARVPLETSGDLESVEEIEALLVELPDLGLIRLGDVVEVCRKLEDPASKPVFQNGDPAIILAVVMEVGQDITALGPELRGVVDDFVASQPIGMNAEFSTFQPKIVADSVNGALLSMGQTLAVVLGMMLLFLGWREALVIASIVPFAVSFAFGLLGPLGVELQQVSIAAIIISLGLLVDNGLVIVEDMERRIQSGEPREQAALAAGRQYTVPLLVASITTVSAFLPLFLLEGTEGQYGYSLSTVVMLMLAGSFLSALYLLPRLAVWVIPEPSQDTKEPGFFDRIADGYAAAVKWIVRAPLLTVGLIVFIVVGCASLMKGVPNQLFPLSERAQFLVYVDLPRGTDIAVTEEVTLELSDWLSAQEATTSTTSYVGSGGPRFVLSLDPAEDEPAAAFMIVNTTTFDASTDLIDHARDYVAGSFPEASIRFKRLAMAGREPGVDIKISGPDADMLLGAALEVRAAFASAPGIVENRHDWGARKFEGRVEVSQDRLREYGLTSRDVSGALAGFFDGSQISTYARAMI